MSIQGVGGRDRIKSYDDLMGAAAGLRNAAATSRSIAEGHASFGIFSMPPGGVRPLVDAIARFVRNADGAPTSRTLDAAEAALTMIKQSEASLVARDKIEGPQKDTKTLHKARTRLEQNVAQGRVAESKREKGSEELRLPPDTCVFEGRHALTGPPAEQADTLSALAFQMGQPCATLVDGRFLIARPGQSGASALAEWNAARS